MLDITTIPSIKVPLTDPNSQLITTQWYRFLYNLNSYTATPTGVIPTNRGGTGQSSYTNGQILIGNSITGSLNKTTLTASSGINIVNGPGSITISSTGVTSLTAGVGIALSGTTGDITITNTRPDQIVTITGAGTTTVTGTYPNFLITSNDQYAGTVTSVGTGTGLTGGPITTTGTINFAVAAVGTWAAVPSSANLLSAMTTKTGTGLLVFGSTPTLSSPLIDGTSPWVDFGNGNAVTLAAGRMWYTPNTGAWNLGMGNGNITQQVGEEFFRYGKASAAISDTNLQLVYKTGTVGASGVITFAPTVAGITDPDQIIGIATEDIANNGFGRVTTMGVVHGINTTGSVYGETWADNDDIWYNPVTGGLTKVKPVAPNIKLAVGTVINAGPGGSGSFSVKIGSSSTLGGTDSNVQLTAVTATDLLQYNGTYWTNVTPASVFSSIGGAPVTKTANFTVAAGETWLINNKSGSTCTVTLPSASTNTGRTLTFQNHQAQLLVSASSNVVPLGGGSAGTAILDSVAGNWATMVSDGTNWVIMQAAPNNIMLV